MHLLHLNPGHCWGHLLIFLSPASKSSDQLLRSILVAVLRNSLMNKSSKHQKSTQSMPTVMTNLAVRERELLRALKWEERCPSRPSLKADVSLFSRFQNTGYMSHAERVVSKVKAEGGLLEFQKRWRQHFLNSMKPRFLPKLWSVDHHPQS